MRPFLLLIALPFLWLFEGCGEPAADLSTPKTHASGSIIFNYPENWRVTEDSVTPEFQYLFVGTPGDALVILHSYPTGVASDLAVFSKEFAERTSAETPIGKMAKSTFTDIPDAGGYDWIAEDFEISLLGQSVPHRRLYGTKEIAERQVFLILQVATEDYSKAEAGFQLIRDSLQGSQKAEGGADQPANAPESKSEGEKKPKPESEERSQ